MLYRDSTTASPCPDEFTESHRDQYWRDGFLAFEEVISPDEVDAARRGLRQILDGHAFNDDRSRFEPPKSESGKAHFFGRHSRLMIEFEPGYSPDPAVDDMDELDLKVRKFMWFEDETPVFRDMIERHPKIHAIVSGILEDTAVIYQTMALVKPPHGGVTKPWHQDNAYFSVSDLDRVLGVWIALDPATAEKGCMHVLPGGHRKGPLKHEHTSDCEIVPGRFDPSQARPIPLRPGGALFFHGNLPHFTPSNHTAQRRRALQYHYRAASNAVVPNEAYHEIFREADGTPASCAYARNRDHF